MTFSNLDAVTRWVKSNVLFTAWVFAGLALLGSISLSELWGFEPCRLCWYQRYLLFATVVFLGLLEYKKLYRLYKIIIPITIAGWCLAFYQSLLQWGVIKESLTCAVDAPCALAQINWFGFITIPFMSLMVFTILNALMIIQHFQFVKQQSDY